jgi:hypothetical protein
MIRLLLSSYLNSILHKFLFKSYQSTFDAEIDAEGNETVFMRSDVFGGALIVEPPEREEIRLYARNGKSCAMPLLHVNPDTPDIISDTTVSFKKNQTFVECYWCCRMFPEDMLTCSDCSDKDPAYYCDKDCQQKAFFVHRRFCPRS